MHPKTSQADFSPDDELGSLVLADVDTSNVLSEHSRHHHLDAADKQDDRHQRTVAKGDMRIQQFPHDNEKHRQKAQPRTAEAAPRRQAKRLDGERRETVHPQPDQFGERVAGATFFPNTMLDGHVRHFSSRAQQQAKQIRIGTIVADDFIDDKPPCRAEAGYLQAMGLSDKLLRHPAIDTGTEIAE